MVENGRNGHQRTSQSRKVTAQEVAEAERNGFRIELPPVAPEGASGDQVDTPIPLNTPSRAAPFPLEILPAPLRQYVQEAAWATNTPPDYTAVPMLCAAGGAIGNSRRLEIKEGHTESACLFAVTIGRPGSCKSAPLKFIGQPFHLRQDNDYAAFAKKHDDWDETPRKERGKEPVMSRCLADDATLEALIRVLGENPRGVLWSVDELSDLLAGLNQYKGGGKGNDKQKLLKIWSDIPLTVDRMKNNGKPVLIRHPFAAIVGGIPPNVLQSFRAECAGDDGFLDRFLFAYPEPIPPEGEQFRKLSRASAQRWQATVAKLMTMKMAGKEGYQFPIDLHLDQQGREEWARLTAEDAAERRAPEFPGWLEGAWAKLGKGYLARLALIVQLLRWACGETKEDEVVEGRSLEDAGLLVGYFKAHTRRCYQVMGADPRFRVALMVLRWLQNRRDVGEFRRSDAWEALHGSLMGENAQARSEDLIRPLNLLVDHRYLSRVQADAERQGAGRKPTEGFKVTHLWDRQSIGSIG